MFSKYGLSAPDCRCDMNNLAFSAYAAHQQSKDDIVAQINEAIANGMTDIHINTNTGFDYSDQDLEDIINTLIEELEKPK